MNKALMARIPGWEVWVGHFRFDQWDASVRRMPVQMFRDVREDELVPGGPFPTRREAGQAGMVYARTKMRSQRQVPLRAATHRGARPTPVRKRRATR